MTYENRLPANYAFGQLTGAAAISDTTLTSTDFATYLPTGLSTTNYVPLTLQDPSTHNFEIVWVNAHSAAASTCTVVRGKEGSSARAWGTGTLWVIAPTLRDGVLWVATRASLPSDPHIGLRCFVQDEQLMMERGLAGWVFTPNTLIARKTADESVTSSAALQNDDHLVVSVQANSVYALDGYLFYTGAGDAATGGLAIDWTLPAAASISWSSFGTNQNTSPFLLSYDAVVQTASGGRTYGSNGATQMSLQPKGVVTIAGTAGTVQMRWAQGGSNATATVLKAGSFIRLTRLN